MLEKLKGALWRLLPDRCEMPGCQNNGVRGNENVVGGRRMCDDCHALWHGIYAARDGRSPVHPNVL